MQLNGIEFGNTLGASGVQGFFGEGYWFHPFLKPLGLNFAGMTFVSKTTTLHAQEGNMPLSGDFTPRVPIPSCIKIRPLRGVMLNAVGLSGPGLWALLETGLWQRRTEPFFISIMSVAESPEERCVEYQTMATELTRRRKEFRASFGLQINLSCPNTNEDPAQLIGETRTVLQIMSEVGVPQMPKFCIATAPVKAVMELEKDPNCDGVCSTNAIPFGWDGIYWESAWGSTTSPLEHLGGGALSGAPLLAPTCDWIEDLRHAGFTKPINGGGGILHPRDVRRIKKAGANSVFIGAAATLRPWKVQGIIQEADRAYCF